MERARGLRRVIQGFLFPDLDVILTATEQLSTRVDHLDKSVILVNKSLGDVDDVLSQVDKGMVQLDYGMNRVDKEISVLGRGIGLLNKGMGRLNVNVDDLEKELNLRLESLKVRFEAEHNQAMRELLSVTKFETLTRTFENLEVFADQGPESSPSSLTPEEPAPRIGGKSTKKPSAPAAMPSTGDRAATRPADTVGPWKKPIKPLDELQREREPQGDISRESATELDFAAVLEEIKHLRNGR